MQLASLAAKHGGRLLPLMSNPHLTHGRALLNPCVTKFKSNRYFVTIRLTNFILPPEINAANRSHRQVLIDNKGASFKSEAIGVLIDEDLRVVNESKIDFAESDPQWIYHGIEDLRLATWNDKVYASGTRRDFQSDGRGRIEIVELEPNEDYSKWRETDKTIPKLDDQQFSYVEKNWAPVQDQPFSFIRWNLPTQIIELRDWQSGQSNLRSEESTSFEFQPELRGGTQLVRWGNQYLSFVHQSFGQKSYLGATAITYRHRLVSWNSQLKIQNVSRQAFGVMSGQVEFLSGATPFKDGLLLSFGFQDACAYLLELPRAAVEELIEWSEKEEHFS